MPTVIIPPTDVSPYTGTGDQVLATAPTLSSPIANSLTGPTATNLTLSGGSSGASLVLEQGTTASATIIGKGAQNGLRVKNTGANVPSIYLMVSDVATSDWNLQIPTSKNLRFDNSTGNSPVTITQANGNVLIGGGASPADITGSGGLKVFGTTDASSTNSGSLQTLGGLGVAKAAVIGGNLGLGSAASSWGSGAKAIQGPNGSLAFYDGATDQLWLSQNAYWDGSWKYIANGFASSLQQYNGELYFYSAGSGSSGGSITLSEKLKLDSSGNLTVSGTGTSSFAGPVTVANTASTSSYQTGLRLQSTVGSAPNTVQSLEFFSSSLGVALGAVDVLRESGSYASSLRFWYATSGGTLTEGARLNSGGNLLLGTTTDGGQKLQVAGTVNISNAGSSTIANFTNSANADFQIVLTASTSAKIGPSTPTSLILQTNNTTALTLDSSQNATFAGFVGIKDGMTAPSATAGTAKIYVDTADGDLKVIFGDGTVKTIVTD